MSGTVAVSIYSLAATLNNLFISISTAISGVLLPKMSKLVAEKASDEILTKEFIKVGRIQYYIIFLMCSGLILVGKEFFMFWAGNKYVESYYISLLLIIPVCIPLIQNLGISIRQAKNKHKFSSIINVFSAILNIIISIPLAKSYGAIGAALGTTIGLSISTVIQNLYYHCSIKLNVLKFWKNIIFMTIPFSIPWLIILVIKKILILNGVISILVYGGLFTILYCIIAYLFCMNNYEKSLIKKIISIKRGAIKND